jgi:hypothetical protein
MAGIRAKAPLRDDDHCTQHSDAGKPGQRGDVRVSLGERCNLCGRASLFLPRGLQGPASPFMLLVCSHKKHGPAEVVNR